METWTISARELYDELESGHICEILDVRNRDEYDDARIESRTEVPMRNEPVYEVLENTRTHADRTVGDAVIVCGHGNGSALVVEEFAALGKETRSLAGGMEAWGQLLVAKELDVLAAPASVWQVHRPAKGCLSYVIGVPGESCIVVDPARHLETYLELAEAQDMRITHVVDTHVHADHISGGPALAEHQKCEYHLPPEDSGQDLPFVSRALVEGDEIALGEGTVVTAMTMHLPGHTPGTTALLVGGRLLLVGDTIFVRGLGRPDLTGQAEELARSLFASVHDRLQPLDPATVVAPAHWSSGEEFDHAGAVLTTLAQVFEATLLNETAIERFVAEIVGTLPDAPDSYDTIRRVNAGKMKVSEEELETLDVGRNQCAAASTLGDGPSSR